MMRPNQIKKRMYIQTRRLARNEDHKNLQYAKVNSWHIFSTIKAAQSKALEINPTASMYPGRTL